MKYSISLIFGLTLFFILIVIGQSCEKAKPGALTIHFHPKAGDQELAYNTPYTINGVSVKFTRAQFYLSSISLKMQNSADDFLYNGYLLVSSQKHHYELGEVPHGIVKNLEFNVGIDEVANHSDPSAFPSTNPLSSENPDFQHWSWDAGYRFITLEGVIDLDGDDTYETTLEMHIGKDSNLSPVAISGIDFQVEEGTNTLAIDVDYAKFLSGLDLATESISHTGDAPIVTEKLISNVSSVFSIQ